MTGDHKGVISATNILLGTNSYRTGLKAQSTEKYDAGNQESSRLPRAGEDMDLRKEHMATMLMASFLTPFQTLYLYSESHVATTLYQRNLSLQQMETATDYSKWRPPQKTTTIYYAEIYGPSTHIHITASASVAQGTSQKGRYKDCKSWILGSLLLKGRSYKVLHKQGQNSGSHRWGEHAHLEGGIFPGPSPRQSPNLCVQTFLN